MRFHTPIERVPTKYCQLEARIESLEKDVYLPIECADHVERKQVWDFLMSHFPDMVITQRENWLWVRKGDWTHAKPTRTRTAANGR